MFRRYFVVVVAVMIIGILTACSGPSGPGTNQVAQTPAAGPVNTALPTGPVTLDLYIETGFPLPKRLADEFTRQHPNVTFNIREDQFQVITENGPRQMAGSNPPDLVRLPQVVGPAKQGLLLNLDPYYKAYGWDKWSQSLLDQMRVGSDGIRGHGPLYGLGIGYNVTGVFYNKKLAAQIGMTSPPATIDEFEALLVKAKAAGLLPIMQFNDIGGINFPYQALANQFADPARLADWIYNKPGATINYPGTVKAAEYIMRWGENGYFPQDANSLDYTTMMGRFEKGQGLFMFNGDWESANLDKAMPGNVGFFLFPPEKAGGRVVAMSAPGTYVIPAKAKHAAEMVYFLNWVHTNEAARKLTVETTGASPGGPPNLSLPPIQTGTVLAQTLAATRQLATSGIAIDFFANATPGIYANAFRPELQLLVAGKETPEGFVQNIQQSYQKELQQ
ncbi:MAG TPA: extracellular solute-binding protein [Ktedonobacteraceae bacterium]|nr:extracellular solute-binding protein [Ktedonobacteraceae bacterium]